MEILHFVTETSLILISWYYCYICLYFKNNDSGSIVKVDGYKMVKVCENSRDHKIHPTVGMVNYTDSIHYMYPQLAASGNYSCCNADGVCMEQVFQILGM